MKIYKKNKFLFVFTSIATTGLAILLLIPFINNYILNNIIFQETGINTKYYYRPIRYFPSKNTLNVKEKIECN